MLEEKPIRNLSQHTRGKESESTGERKRARNTTKKIEEKEKATIPSNSTKPEIP